ncbi:hypothetical protein [Mesobacillus foraminis]|uniref:hypothetical protein n=1 Tax=Mesobacillus foraminis TaxID=279826 RepID=UPI000EF53E89|nr:hypothetical protein [Mesobacillus foraminis]
MENTKQGVVLKNFLRVRLVSDFNKSLNYYQDILGFKVDGWGHAILGDQLGFILQQANSQEDIRPNARPGKVQWEGQRLAGIPISIPTLRELGNYMSSLNPTVRFSPMNQKWKRWETANGKNSLFKT